MSDEKVWKFESGVINASRDVKELYERVLGDDKVKQMKECVEKGNDVVISKMSEKKINRMLKAFPKLEWTGVLIGDKREYTNAKEYYTFVTDVIILPQEVTGVTTELDKDGEKMLSKLTNVVGWIHSHNEMSAFHSGVDDDTAHDYDVSITVNNKRDYVVKVRKDVFGVMAIVNGRVLLEEDDEADDEFMKNAKQCVKERVSSSGYTSGYYDGYDGVLMPERMIDTCYYCNQKVGKKRVLCAKCGFPMHKTCAERESEDGKLCGDCEDGFEMSGHVWGVSDEYVA